MDEIRLYDINKERQDKVAVVVDWVLHKELDTNIKLVVTTDVQQAYTDTSLCLPRCAWAATPCGSRTKRFPLRHGCVGQETCGCGGMAYGMRTIFPMIKLIDDVEKYAKKDYWILNYSNPAAIVSEACRKLRPKARIINICDMPIAIIDVVAAALGIQNKKDDRLRLLWSQPLWLRHLDPPQGRGGAPQLREYIKEHEILLPDSYLKGMGSLMAKNPEEAVDEHPDNRRTKGSWYYVWKGEYSSRSTGVPAQHVPELLPAAEDHRAFQPRAHPCKRG